ncbi:MAG: hypothetical protein ABIP81_06120 [Terriglobales bacterium]
MLLVGGAAAQQGTLPIGEVQGTDANVRGAVSVGPTGTTLMSGSQVTAGATPTTIKLVRGGELKVCAGSSITITASASGREALVGLSAGAIETHYRLSSSADTIMTPDFRLLLPGPGDFHFAIGIKGRGDMCVKSMPGNSSAMIVHEVFGEGTHQVRPGDTVVFQKGSVQTPIAVAVGEECGCVGAGAAKLEVGKPAATPAVAPEPVAPQPAVAEPVVAQPTVSQPVASQPVASQPRELGFPEQQSERAAAAIAAGQSPPPTAAPLPGVSSNRNEVITKVDAPIVFRGEDLPAGKAEVSPSLPTANAAPAPGPTAASPTKPRITEPKVEDKSGEKRAEPAKPAKKKWYQRFGSALAKLFRG